MNAILLHNLSPALNDPRPTRSPVNAAGDADECLRLRRALAAAIQRERRRIGGDLHDGLCQRLFGAAILTERLRRDLEAQALPEAGAAERVFKEIEEAIVEARGLARGLSCRRVTANSLVIALRRLAAETSELFPVACVAQGLDGTAVNSSTQATHVHGIAREAVHNAIKHGHPLKITIELARHAAYGFLSVIDDGIGFDEAPNLNLGLGLRRMRERAAAMGADLTIRRAPHGGTLVSCRFPCVAAGETERAAEPTLP